MNKPEQLELDFEPVHDFSEAALEEAIKTIEAMNKQADSKYFEQLHHFDEDTYQKLIADVAQQMIVRGVYPIMKDIFTECERRTRC